MDPTGGTLRLIVDSRVPDGLQRNGPRGTSDARGGQPGPRGSH